MCGAVTTFLRAFATSLRLAPAAGRGKAPLGLAYCMCGVPPNDVCTDARGELLRPGEGTARSGAGVAAACS
jgi:hypothetical protein